MLGAAEHRSERIHPCVSEERRPQRRRWAASAPKIRRGAPDVTPRSHALDLDDDGLEVRHLLEREASADSPDAALLARAASERQVRLPIVGRLIDVDPTGLEPIREAQGPGEV